MPRTEVRGGQLKDQTVGRSDFVVATPGEAVTTKIVAGSGITVSGTGVDSGTGDVTLGIRIENRTTDPATPAVGAIWLRTDL